MKVVAGIVLYNPDINRLKSSISELISEVDKICLIDNASLNINDIEKLATNNVFVIKNEKNFGIAKALNQLLDFSYQTKADYLLTLDQDSILKKSMLEIMLNYVNEKDVAMICPIINDLNRKKVIKQQNKIKELDRCITSGTLMNLELCKEIGYFDEKMFIDYVDFDYCKRIKLAGKKIIRVKGAVINHEIGKRSKHKFLFLTVYPTNHNSTRIYYYARNIKYYCRKYKNSMDFKEKLMEYMYLVWKFVSIILYEDYKKEKIKKFVIGLKDSKKIEVLKI